MKKKILSFIAVLSLLASLCIPVAPAQAAMGIKHELEVSLMAALGIMPGYPDNYNADETVKQKDFVDYAYRAVGASMPDADSAAKNFGMTGDEDITVSQAADVLMNVTEYALIARGTNQDNITFAQSTGLFSGVSGSMDAKLTKENAAVLLYNATQLDAVEYNNRTYSYSDESIMEEKLNVYKETGIITANTDSALTGYGTTSKYSVRIGDDVYAVGNTYAASLLGQYVRFYYCDDRDSGELQLKWIEPDSAKNTVVKVYGCDVDEIDGNTVRYYSTSGGTKTVRLENNADIIYNGRRADSLSIDVLTSLTCEATFIDNGSGKGYNVVIIKDYTYYLVDSFTASTSLVNDFGARTTLSLDEGDYTSMSIYKDGIAATVNDIEVGQVLAVAKSDDGNLMEVEIITGSVSGEITGVNTDYVIIGGESYDISPAYAGDQLKIGRNGTFYFDKLGKIVRCAALKAQNSKYGYLMKYYSDGDGEDGYVARVLTAEGEVKDIPVKNSITFNGMKKTSKDVSYLIDAANNCEQLINYTISSDNTIATMKTADEKYIGIDESALDDFTLHYRGNGRYRKNNMSLNSKYLVDSQTPIFLIPYSGEREDYTVVTASYLTNNYTYDISVYDIDDYMYAGALVIKEGLIEPENLRSKRAMIITSVEEGLNADDEECVIFEGYRQGSKVSFVLADGIRRDNRGNVDLTTLKEGDVIQFGVNTKNEINAVQLLFRASTQKLSIAGGTGTPNSYWEGGTATFPDLWASTGTVTDRNAEVILVDDDGDDTKLTKHPHKLGNVTTYLYDHGEVSASNKNEISIGDVVYVHEYQGNVQEILIVRDKPED